MGLWFLVTAGRWYPQGALGRSQGWNLSSAGPPPGRAAPPLLLPPWTRTQLAAAIPVADEVPEQAAHTALSFPRL